jgi:hypothetical protein
MSSATVMFVLREMMRAASPGARGCAMSFGPGLIAETMLFRAVGSASPDTFDRAADRRRSSAGRIVKGMRRPSLPGGSPE